MMKRAYAVAFGMAVASWIGATPAHAHHSFGMFDQAKTVTFKGTVTKFEFTNPHAWVWFKLDEKGEQQVWGLEGPGTSMFKRMGFSRTTFKPGDEVTFTLHPLRNGEPGGQLLTATLSDGRVFDMERALRETLFAAPKSSKP